MTVAGLKMWQRYTLLLAAVIEGQAPVIGAEGVAVHFEAGF